MAFIQVSFKMCIRDRNMTSRKEYSYTTGTLGTAVKTDVFTYRTSGWKDQLISYNGSSISLSLIHILKTRDGTLQAQTEIFDHLRENGHIIINGDDDKLSTVGTVHGLSLIHISTADAFSCCGRWR